MSEFRVRGIDLVRRAQQAEAADQLEEALRLYQQGLDCLVHYRNYEKCTQLRNAVEQHIDLYISRAEEIKTALTQKACSVHRADAAAASSAQTSSSSSHHTKNDQALRDQITDTMLVKRPSVSMDSVAGLHVVKEVLRQAVVYPLSMQQLFANRVEPWSGILLYGPPGTGKTLIAKAVASEVSGSTFMQVTISKIMSKYVGESERLVEMLFRVARENKPVVMFIDEVDALVSQRNDGEHEVSRKVKNMFLQEMDGVGSQNSGVLVLCATNMPWTLDDAFLRRMQRRIYIPRPCAESRASILSVLLKDVPHTLTPEHVADIAAATDEWTGSDLNTLVRTARNRQLQSLSVARHFVETGPDKMLVPCASTVPGARELSMADIKDKGWLARVQLPDVSVDDFTHALVTVKPSPLSQKIEKYEEWTTNYGERGSD
jgi:vacuolar protein-sorting-associated protein 4